MDDEAVVRDAICGLCQSLGYETQAAADCASAIQLFVSAQALGRPFTAVLLDLTIRGGPGGQEALAAIRAHDPAVPIYVISGYSEQPIMATPARFGFTGALSKPITRQDLARALSLLPVS